MNFAPVFVPCGYAKELQTSHKQRLESSILIGAVWQSIDFLPALQLNIKQKGFF